MKAPEADKLIKTFFRRSFFLTLVLALALAIVFPSLQYAYENREYEKETVEFLRTFVTKELDFELRKIIDDPESFQSLITKITVLMEYQDYVEFKLWGRDTTVLYSFTDPELIGKTFPGNEELLETLREQKFYSHVEKIEAMENSALKAHGKLIEIYGPIVRGGESVGAIEVYRKPAPVKFLGGHGVLISLLSLCVPIGLYLLLYGHLKRAILIMSHYYQESKQAEAELEMSLGEKETLLKEIHHRVKNNLHAISALLNLQAAHSEDQHTKKTLMESQNRIRTMALIHEQLYQSDNLTSVDFSCFISKLVEYLIASYRTDVTRIKILLDVDNVRLVMDTAIPCGLVISELVSNSLTHAFPDGKEGVIRIEFRSLGDELYSLYVTDDGVGLPDEVELVPPRTMGMQLVTTISAQLGGEVALDRKNGTAFRMIFKEYREAGSELY